MSFPRTLLVILGLAVVAPTVLTSAQGKFWPERVGTMAEREVVLPEPARSTPYVYDAPEDAGTAHVFAHKRYFGMGAAQERQWYGFGPTIGAPRAAIVLLHGSNRSGRSMIDMWREVALRNDLVLIAPNAAGPSKWVLWEDGPDFLQALLREAGGVHPIDPDRIYLAGHSAGGIFAAQLANLGFGPWRAVATHAGSPNEYTIVPAHNPVPVYAWVGDSDHLFTLERERAVAQRMAQAGHDVTLSVVPGHTHWYYDIGPQIAARMWAQMRK
jgi:poly(3-hydroxybutyrate) depolymerase